MTPLQIIGSSLVALSLATAAHAEMANPGPAHLPPPRDEAMAPRPPHAGPLALGLRPLLPALALTDNQASLWGKAEAATITRQIVQQREQQQAQNRLRDNLANDKLPLGAILGNAMLPPAATDAASAEWRAFFDSLSPQQSAQVRQFLQAQLADMNNMMPPPPRRTPKQG